MRRPTERRAAAGRTRAARAADALVLLGAAGGALAACWWVLTAFFGFGLVTFATGSMAPAFPSGSVAVSRTTRVEDVRVGDVVTVERGAGLLPITHRVRSVRIDGGTATLVLQGDANADPDPRPYSVRAVRRIVAPIPGSADAVRAITGPPGLAVASLIAALGVGRALWPEQERLRGRSA